MEITRVFIHGLESTSQGTKGSYFRERYAGMVLEDFSGPFTQRMEKLEKILAGKNGLIIVGSSYGGLMAAVFACRHEERVRKLILLAPALHLDSFKPCLATRIRIPVTIYHGLKDDVVPLSAVREVAPSVFGTLDFNAVDDDHSLHGTFAALDWDVLLEVQGRSPV